MNIYDPISYFLIITPFPELYQQIVNEKYVHSGHVSPWNKGKNTGRKGEKRPDQSAVATKRNNNYWAEKGRPVREFNCPICNTPIKTRRPEQKACSKSCGTIVAQHFNGLE